MNKIKTTKKAMKENYRIIGVGYCSMYYLLRCKSPVAYSTRSEGWACDYYNVDGIIISTGYSPLKNKNMDYDYSTLREYEEKAQAIIDDYTLDLDVKNEKVKALLSDFLELSKIK